MMEQEKRESGVSETRRTHEALTKQREEYEVWLQEARDEAAAALKEAQESEDRAITAETRAREAERKRKSVEERLRSTETLLSVSDRPPL